MFASISFALILINLSAYSSEGIRKLNIVRVNLPNVGYKRLFLTKTLLLSAPPLAWLNVSELNLSSCVLNIKTNLWTLGLPIIFWNQRYIDEITKGIELESVTKVLGSKSSTKILPPAEFIGYRLDWRRNYEKSSYQNNIVIDSSWYNAKVDYILPEKQTFVIEFLSENNTVDLCNDTKRKLVTEPIQSQEFVVDFLKDINKDKVVPNVVIKIKDIQLTKWFNDTGCKGTAEQKCFVSLKYAENWAYDVSLNKMKEVGMIHLNMQDEIYSAVLRFICKEKVPLSVVESKVVKIPSSSSNETTCSLPSDVYVDEVKVCDQRYYDYNYREYRFKCRNVRQDTSERIVSSMLSAIAFDEKYEYAVPVTRIE